MITRVFYNNKSFKILNQYSFKFSNNEVSFNDIKIDFTGHSFADIPYKYQEIKIIEAENEESIKNGEVIFTGFLDNIKLSDMKNEEEEREMTLTLLSPLNLATKRTATLVGTYNVETAIMKVLQPLFDDGFILKEINITNGQITVNFLIETVENCMNCIGAKRNIFWYINEKKEIFVYSIDYLFGLPISKTIDGKEEGFIKLQPTIENIDYANVINFKNVRLIYSQANSSYTEDYKEPLGYPIMTTEKNIKNGDIINFDNPIIVDEKYLREQGKILINAPAGERPNAIYSFKLVVELSDETVKTYSIGIDLKDDKSNYDSYIESGNNPSLNQGEYLTTGSISFSDQSGTEGEIVLQRDSFFSNLITGFKWNYNSNATIKTIQSDTALRYAKIKFLYSGEINKLKGIISDSGQIEKTVDYNEKWTTLPQLIEYARSLITQNSNTVNQINIKYDVNPKLKIGDIIKIDMPKFYTQGKFAVKEISYNYNNEIDQEWEIIAKNADLVSTYIDMFRPVEKEETQKDINSIILSEYVEEKLNETHTIEEVIDEN